MIDTPDDSGPSVAPPPGGPEPRRARPSLRSPSDALQPGTPPPPPKAPKRRRRPLLATASGLLSFLGIAAIACILAWSVGMQRLNAPGPLGADKVVNVRPGNDGSAVEQLADEGVVDNRLLMTAALWLEGARGAVKSGEYLFKQGASIRDVIDTLVSGKQILHAVTIPEGLTSEQVLDRLRDNDVLVGDVPAVPAEGTLMPDTYKFARGTTRDQVLRSMQAEQRKVLAEVWAHRSPDLPIRSPFELVTLASIVEKETGRADERPRVAGVFENRLTRNMPLQSDPTIVYGLVGGKGTLGRGLLKSEVEQKTPYNTYTIAGLPPGPIANPGKLALEAVANPSRTRDLYFVADGTGGHAFSDNLDQHRLNVQRWRQIEKERQTTAPAEGAAPASGAAPAPVRLDQRGAIDTYDSKFDEVAGAGEQGGSAGASPGSGAVAALPTFARPDPVSEALPRTAGEAPAWQGNKTAAAASNFEELDINVGGLKSRADPSAWGDSEGFDTPALGDTDQGGTMQTFPVSAQHLADQRARAVALGLLPANASLPESASIPAASQAGADAGPPNGIHLYGKGKVIDFSEGTALDPLRDRTYDLTTAKVVPVAALPAGPQASGKGQPVATRK